MRRISVLLVVVALAASVAVAQGQNKDQELQANGINNWRPGMNRGTAATLARVPGRFAGGQAVSLGTTGTLQYDSGAITALPTIFGQMYGNQFNVSNSGGPLGGTLTASSFHFYFMEDSTADTGLFFQPGDGTGGNAMSALASLNIGGLANSGPSFSAPALNTVSWGALGIGTNTFTSANGVFLGAWCLNANTAFPIDNETLGLDTAASPAGFKGYTVSSGTGPLSVTPGAFNAVLRLTGTAPSIPVELMSFEIN